MSSELERRVAEMIRVGVICEVQPEEGTCRVSFGSRVSPPSRWIMNRAGFDRDFWHPDVGEQVLFLSPYGDASEGFVLAGVFSRKCSLPAGARAGRHIREYGDGIRLEVDRVNHVAEIRDSYGSFIRLADGDIHVWPARDLLMGKTAPREGA